MNAGRALKWGRRRAGLTQRDLAARTGVPQSTIGRIEAGSVDPRVGTLSALLRACGAELQVGRAQAEGVDRSQLIRLIALSPTERIQHAVSAARGLAAIRGAAQMPPRTRRATKGA